MNISYKWLSEYLPVTIDPERISSILTSVGLEVESFEKYEEIKGGLKGLVVGEVISVQKHPGADKLTLTKVNTGAAEPLSIVCGAPNVAAGQKVIVAPVGTTIYPSKGEPMTMRVAKIRGEESHGMICAEDEIGLGHSHEGILVLPPASKVGDAVSSLFPNYEDFVYNIGLTPNRMEAMSHWGVARDICAWFSNHDKKEYRAHRKEIAEIIPDDRSLPIEVVVENDKGCPRYSGIGITNIQIGPSPVWLQQKLKAIGLRPINNIVDITNFILHDTGQPLHAFDADKIIGRKVIVKNLPEGTPFVTLDEKERKLSASDLMICNASEPMCIAGVYGGIKSGVSEKTRNIFLESACFDPLVTRKSSERHGLRTDAASRFEKGTDISATVSVLKKAASMIREICGGKISSPVIDIYSAPKEKTRLPVKYSYIKKLSGKEYSPTSIHQILSSLGFEILNENADSFTVAVPFHKPDISLPADIVEEIMRIDGLDNIAIPGAITITPSVEENLAPASFREKVTGWLTGQGFHEMMTNSITNSAYFEEEELKTVVKMQNSLSADLNIMRPSLFETSLEIVAHNLNHKNNNLRLFEFGKAYSTSGDGKYNESEKLCLVVSGKLNEGNWNSKERETGFFYLKGLVMSVFRLLGLNPDSIEPMEVNRLDPHIVCKIDGAIVAGLGEAKSNALSRFEIKQPVFFAGLAWESLIKFAAEKKLKISDTAKYPAVRRDLAMIVDSSLSYREVEQSVEKINLDKLRSMKLFDIFESEKLGAGKKSMAINFTFRDDERTLTDKEIDEWMKKIMNTLEKNLQASIRKQETN